MAKKLLYGDEARSSLKRGVDAVAHAVRVTIGPKGRNVAFDKGYGSPVITNDGVSIAKEITLTDPFETMGAEIIKEVADKMNKSAGDGTTTATVLTHALITEGMKRIQSGVEVVALKKGIDMATAEVVEIVKKSAKKIKTTEETRQVATISVENPELGVVIAETIEKVGSNGVVTVEESSTFDIQSEIVEGMSIDRGYASPYMVTDNERMEAVFEQALVMITDKKIDSVKDILPILEKALAAGKKDIVVVADDFGNEATATFVINKVRGICNILAIKAPGFGDKKKELLTDIAVLVGAVVITADTGTAIEDVGMEYFGSARKIIASKDKTVIVGGKGKKADIDARVTLLASQSAQVKSTYEKEKLEERIAKLTGGVAIIRVGAATETEMKYLKLKIEDAVNATKAALEEGVVAGGGSALVAAAGQIKAGLAGREFAVEEHRAGYEIVIAACEAPLRQIAMNAGIGDGSLVVAKVQEMGGLAGYNAVTDTYVKNMVLEGIIDPVKVTRNALTNAASSAGTFLTTEVAIAEIPEPRNRETQGGGMEY
jgi:chaperonin GroEL